MKNKPIKIYGDHIEQLALDQFNDSMACEFSVRGALMPDAHAGYSLPIGAVIETDGMVVPSWVGYDIGCGMIAVKTTFSTCDIVNNAKEIFDEIYKHIPVGFNAYDDPRMYMNLEHQDNKDITEFGRSIYDYKKANNSLGTLGGGNHFIEIGYGEDNAIWVIIHSGSRGFGHYIATNYIKLASGEGKVIEGGFGLSIDSDDGKDYMYDMNFALNYSLINRKTIMCFVIEIISNFCDGNIKDNTIINRTHNHAEVKDGKVIHRKGATHAEKGMMGVIPMNMKDGSFIVKGKGNESSLCSSSHGAGRAFSRTQARKVGDMETFKDKMNGIVAKVDESTLDEAPHAYKDYSYVMNAQSDLIEIVDHIKPIINIKG